MLIKKKNIINKYGPACHLLLLHRLIEYVQDNLIDRNDLFYIHQPNFALKIIGKFIVHMNMYLIICEL